MLDGSVVLVTGATGRLGTEACARLETLGATVLPVVLDGYGTRPRRVPWTATTQPQRIRSRHDLAELPRPDWVLNLHWTMSHSGPFARRVMDQFDHNVCRPSYLWDWLRAAPMSRFVNVSSVRVFGNGAPEPVSATTLPAPTSPYGVAKLAAEHTFGALFRDTGTAVTHVRLGSVFAHGEHPSKLVSRMVASAFDGVHIRLNVENQLHLMYVDEAIDRIVETAQRSGASWRIIAGRRERIGDVASLLETVSGRRLNADRVVSIQGDSEPRFVLDQPPVDQPWIRATSLRGGIERFVAKWQSAHLASQ